MPGRAQTLPAQVARKAPSWLMITSADLSDLISIQPFNCGSRGGGRLVEQQHIGLGQERASAARRLHRRKAGRLLTPRQTQLFEQILGAIMLITSPMPSST